MFNVWQSFASNTYCKNDENICTLKKTYKQQSFLLLDAKGFQTLNKNEMKKQKDIDYFLNKTLDIESVINKKKILVLSKISLIYSLKMIYVD